jgi:thiol-disulfide isomerase/thioredoxin
MAHPGVEDLGMPFESLDLEYDRPILDSFYMKIIKEKKKYIISQIGKVNSELICQQLLHTKYSEEEIFSLEQKFDPIAFTKPYGRQVKKIADYVARKKAVLGELFPQIFTEKQDGSKYQLPNIQPQEYILLHFYTSYCNSCKEKNHYFANNSESFAVQNIKVINICTDYFPRNWKKMLEEEAFHNEHLYINRVKFMGLAEEFILELSSTLLLDYTYTIVSRDKYKLEEVFDKSVFE